MSDQPRMPRQSSQRRGADKRSRILKAAVRVFAREGFHGARIAEIARVAGVADGTIYLYFRNKEDLLLSLFEEHVGRLNAMLRDGLASLPATSSRVEHGVRCQVGLVEDRRDLAEVLSVTLRQSNRFLRQFAGPTFTEYLEILAEVVADGQRRGEIDARLSPMVVARALFGALDGLMLTWALGRSPADRLERAAMQVAEILVRGLAPPATS